MKLSQSILLAVLPIVLLATSCKKEPAAKTTAGHFLTATSSSIGTFSATGTEVGAGGAAGAKITINAETSAGAKFVIYINPYAGVPGVLALPGGEHLCAYLPASGGAISSVSGNITLTATTPDIIGTFNYTGTDGSTFSGSFNVGAP
jgi:hypothetical protein